MRVLKKTFSDLKSKNEGALITYVAAGDPNPSTTPEIVEALFKGGSDIVELGIPFSDPIADGPTIQTASIRALKAGITPKKVFKIVDEIKQTNKQPLVTMTYFNSIYKMGLKEFFESASASGIAGVIVPDLPIEEAKDYKVIADSYDIDTIFFATPSTSLDRIKKTLEYTSGFLYLVSIFGVTGARTEVQDITLKLIKNTHSVTQGKIPLAVGFGISEPNHVKTILERGADAAIIGSAIVKIVETYQNKVSELLNQLRIFCKKLKESTIKN